MASERPQELEHTGNFPLTPVDRGAVYNERGVIAESYQELQGLGALRAARDAYPLPRATAESTLRAIFQGVEIGLLNAADLVRRAASDMERGDVDAATVKMFWMRGFHRLLVRLSVIPQQLGLGAGETHEHGTLCVAHSPAFREYFDAVRRLDESALRRIDSGALAVDAAIAGRSVESADYNLFHLLRVAGHESTIWERNLTQVRVPVAVTSYESFVSAGGIRAAVYERELSGDTFFTQFRGLHQIPETLGEEVNDRLEAAIRAVRDDELREAAEHLRCVNVLSEGILASLPAIVDCLATSDYHRIRENLGLTSGSHSVCLRFHMFTHLYEQLWEEVGGHVTRLASAQGGAAIEGVESAVRWVERQRFADSRTWLLCLLCDECLKLRAFIFQWRDEHLNLPRNNLGGEHTRSLTGSPDAVKAVEQMRDAARSRDMMLPLARARGLDAPTSALPELTRYLSSDASLDSRILDATGRATQSRFHDVQERLGFFANRCPFSAPPRRRA